MTTKYLKVGFLNVGSLGTKHDELVVAIQEQDFDIIALNETWLRASEEGRAPTVPEYRLQHIPRSSSVKRGRGGGVGFYSKRGLNTRIHLHPIDPFHTSVEQMWLTTTIAGTKLAIGTAYRPPWQDIDIFLDALTSTVSALSDCQQMILMGDFNVNVLREKDHKTEKLKLFLGCMGLTQLVQSPTHTTIHGDSLIDLVCSNSDARSISVKVIPDLGAHALITAEFNYIRNKTRPKTIIFRPLKGIPLKSLEEDLELINWNDITNNNINETVTELNRNILKVMDKYAPKKIALVKECPYPWITDNIRLMMHIRNEAHGRYRRRKSESRKQYYKDLKSLVTKSLFYEKCAYYKSKINSQVHDAKVLWKNLKSTLVPSRSNIEIPNHFDCPDRICNFFLNVPGNEKIDISTLSFYEFGRFGDSEFSLQEVSQQAIAKVLGKIKSRAEGIDGINLDMFLLTLPYSLGLLTSIINSSIRSSTFPEAWKIARIKPLPKKVNAVDFGDLRPVSVLPMLSKVLEKVVCSQLVTYLENNNILPSVQSGFRKAHSTSTALLDVVDNIITSQDDGMCTILVLLDFTRAFDCVNINLILSKMSYYGFNAATVNWFHSYLSGRTQYVEIKQKDGSTNCSKLCAVTRGVPQGSILGPILFILYCADIVKIVKKCKYHIYADDTQVYISFKPDEYAEALKSLNEDLERIVQWCKVHSLVLNPLKMKYLVFGTRAQLIEIGPKLTGCITIMGEQIVRVDEARNLGIIMDAELRFERHIAESIRNCFYRLKVLYKARPFLSEELRTLLVETLILSKLNYVDTVYGPRLFSRSERVIQRLQNACTRFCFDIPRRSHVTPYYNKHNILKMKARRRLHLACLMFRITMSKAPSYLYNKLEWRHERDRRIGRLCTPQLSIPHHRTSAFRGSFRYAATKCWNNIPPPIKHCTNSSTFRLRLRIFLMEHQRKFENIRANVSAI